MIDDVPSSAPGPAIDDVLSFWLEEIGPDRWFVKDEAVDRRVAECLGSAHERAASGSLDAWRSTAEGSLALCILLDQVPRNLFRGSPRAFATDALARQVARGAIDRGFDMAVPERTRMFFYLPFEHSEDLDHQHLCVRLFEERTTDANVIGYAHKHREVIERFGRFPHRNDVLGRDYTPEERAFLQDRGAMF